MLILFLSRVVLLFVQVSLSLSGVDMRRGRLGSWSVFTVGLWFAAFDKFVQRNPLLQFEKQNIVPVTNCMKVKLTPNCGIDSLSMWYSKFGSFKISRSTTFSYKYVTINTIFTYSNLTPILSPRRLNISAICSHMATAYTL